MILVHQLSASKYIKIVDEIASLRETLMYYQEMKYTRPHVQKRCSTLC